MIAFTRSQLGRLVPSLVLLLAALWALGIQSWTPSASLLPTGPGLQSAASGWPLVFVPNAGQTHPAVRFQVNSMGGVVFFTPQEMVVSLPASTLRSELAALRQGELAAAPTVVRVRFEGASPAPEITGLDRLPGSVNYFIGNDPEHWHTSLPTYASVIYRELYPGIDLRYDGEGGTLKGTYVVTPGADPARIQLTFAGVDNLEIDERGDLVVRVASGEIRQAKPYVYQEVGERRTTIPTHYVLDSKHLVRFQVAAYDTSRPLIIDPQVDYASFLGGDYEDGASSAAVDASGNVYVTGNTDSSDFPTQNPPLQPGGRRDAFVAKLSADGQSLMYATYLGGDRGEYGTAIALDGSGNAYIAGYTSSFDFPTAAATQSSLGGETDAFVTKLNSSGSALAFSTYMGGTSFEYAQSIAVDSGGDVYVAGYTNSSDFPTVNPQQPTSQGGGNDAFVAKLESDTPTVLYATYLGGTGEDRANGIACDANGNAYVVGETRSIDFPVAAGAFQTTGGGDWFDAFLTSFNSAGSAHRYSTYLGGSEDDDRAYAVAVDASGKAYVTGHSESQYFPTTPGAYDTTCNGGWDSNDAFVTQINSDGSGLVFSTYLGGTESDEGRAIALDKYSNVYVAGNTFSTDFPIKDAFQGTHGGGTGDAFVAQFNPLGSDLVYASYLGGSDYDWATAIALDDQRHVYVVGITQSANFPTTRPFDASYGDSGDGFVVRLEASSLAVTGLVSPTGGRLLAPGGEAAFIFPSGAFTQTVRLTYTPMAQVEDTGVMLGVGRAYELTAVYSDTSQPAQIAPGASYSVIVTYTTSGAAVEDSLALYYWDGAQWAAESTSQVDTVANTVSATPGHLSKWAILGQTHRLYLPCVARNYSSAH